MTIAHRKEREKKLRRLSILMSARQIIAKSGVEEMSMNQLAEATELNKATLYLYFSSKDDLIDAIVYEGLQVLEKKLEESDARFETGLDRVLNQVSTIFTFYRENPVYFYTFNHQERRSSNLRREGPYADRGNEIASRIFDKTASALKLGKEQGEVRKDIDINVFLILMFAQVYGSMHTIYTKEDVYSDVLSLDTADIERSAVSLLRYFLEERK